MQPVTVLGLAIHLAIEQRLMAFQTPANSLTVVSRDSGIRNAPTTLGGG